MRRMRVASYKCPQVLVFDFTEQELRGCSKPLAEVLPGQSHDSKGLCWAHDAADGKRHLFPFRMLGGEAFAARWCQAVETRAAVRGRNFPFARHLTVSFQAMQRRIERTVIDGEHVIGQAFDGACDFISISRPGTQDLQHHHVERSLKKVEFGFRFLWHARPSTQSSREHDRISTGREPTMCSGMDIRFLKRGKRRLFSRADTGLNAKKTKAFR